MKKTMITIKPLTNIKPLACCVRGLTAGGLSWIGDMGELGWGGDPAVEDSDDTDMGDGTCCCGDGWSSGITTCCEADVLGCCVGQTPSCCNSCWSTVWLDAGWVVAGHWVCCGVATLGFGCNCLCCCSNSSKSWGVVCGACWTLIA